MHVLIIGAGGVGGYFGARWAEAGIDITLMARGEHHDAIASDGLRVLSPMGDCHVPVRVINKLEDDQSADLVIVATKTWQLKSIAITLSEFVQPSTRVVGLQNGVEAASVLASTLGDNVVLGGTCRIISFIEQPGVIRHTGVDPTLILGERNQDKATFLHDWIDTLNAPDAVTVRQSDHIDLELWKKFLFFAPVSGMGSVTRSEIGEFRSIPESRNMLEAAMHEIIALAQAMSIELHPSLVASTLSFVDVMPADATTSMQRDFMSGRRTELDALAGAVVRLGEQLDVPTPVHAAIHAALLPQELRAQKHNPEQSA